MRRARLTFPPQGKTSDVAFATHGARTIVVKRCAHRIYLDWLRREQFALRALAESGLPIPRFIAYAEAETEGQPVGWLLLSRLSGSPLLGALIEAPPSQRTALFRRLGELVRRLHATRVPPDLEGEASWLSRQIERARGNLPWCDGTAAGLVELERSRPHAVRETLIHGDLSLDNVLVDERGELHLIDWADGGLGDPRHDLALALQTKPELTLSGAALDAFFAAYGAPALDEATRDWFVRLYDYF
ncbi:MAG TPA: aminoglycoside phosphotransferase family protein [Rhodanobacteraceae bacterium]|nr:aminoglycoside phosphotransferase family protein [Rhodanobacteraceae bacterium]